MDLNRGVCQKFHPSGKIIGYYFDSPGQFFNDRGIEVSDEIAEEAGFDVKALKKEAKKLAKLEAARKKVEAEFAEEVSAIENEDEGRVPEAPEIRSVRPIPGASNRGGKNFEVIDGNGDVVATMLTRDQADEIVAEFKRKQ